MRESLARRALRPLLITALAVVALGAAPGPGLVAAADLCVDGFDTVKLTSRIIPEDVYAALPSKAILAGSAPLDAGRRAARIVRYDAAGWKTMVTKTLDLDAGFTALGGNKNVGLWAVGFRQSNTRMAPLALRQKADGSWRMLSTPSGGAKSATLTDVAAFKRSAAWAVGYRLDSPGTHRPLALRWDGQRWANQSPGLRKGERATLSGVSSSGKGGTWVAGTVLRFGAEQPLIFRRKAGVWKRPGLPAIGGGALAAISVTDKQTGWAVGHRLTTAGLRPLVLRWKGAGWSIASPPDLGSEAVLDAVSVNGDVVSVSGSVWRAESGKARPFVARLSASGWTTHVLNSFSPDGIMSGVDGDPLRAGWAVGRDLRSGVLVHGCKAPAPATAQKRTVRQARRDAATKAREAEPFVPHVATTRPAPRPGLAQVPKVKPAAAGANVRIVDRAKAVGLPGVAHTYSAVIKDFDRDGRNDIFLNGHADQARLYFDRGASFTKSGKAFGWGDRHGCAADDVNGNGLPDLYCAFGGARGLGAKANQLWLDPGGSSMTAAADGGRALELLGRGRTVIFMDYDADGHKDLIVGQQTNRLDGLPSFNRVFRWSGKGQFSLVKNPGLRAEVGARALDANDFDQDGRVDLLMVSDDPRASGLTSSVRLYRNTKRGFVPVHGARGIRSIGERDAELVRLDGDKRPDLIQLSADRIRISLQRGGRFKTVYERSLSKAVAVAVGDADGDGDKDIYILRQKNNAAVKDLILFNRGGGQSYRVVSAPSRAGGVADDVLPIDHDNNGLMDFLVLNGRGGGKGPVQLISFYRK